MSKWILNSSGNTAMVGAVLLALGIIFGVLDKLPWSGKADKVEVAVLKTDIQRELGEIKTSVEAIRVYLMTAPRERPR